MRGRVEKGSGPVLLNALPVLHHRYAVGELPDNTEIMGDKQHPHVQLALEFAQQLQDLRLYRDIQRGSRLVGDE
ncbi:hypothetical protein SDC9_202953 [bioreactor metagenome]|uniref:Uncharacterized protein n=1 Tax=bioreactor metagenome TaxID=1076179 RepID=A0A645IWL6_9ZZZZ